MGKSSVQNRILFLIAVPALILMAISGAILLSNMNRLIVEWQSDEVARTLDYALERIIQEEMDAQSIKGLSADGDTIPSPISDVAVLATGANVEVIVFDLQSDPLLRSSGEPVSGAVGWTPFLRSLLDQAGLAEAGENGLTGVHDVPGRDRTRVFTFALKVLPDQQLTVLVASTDERLDAFQGELVFGLLLISLAVLVAIVATGLYVSGALVRKPMDALNEAAGKIAHRQTVPHIAISSRDEFGQLARRMEAMSRDLDFYYSELSRERDFNAAILDAAGALMVVLDVEGRIMAFNAACTDLTGRNPGEVIGSPFWEILVARSQMPLARRVFEACLDDRAGGDFEGIWVRHDGKAFALTWRFSRIEVAGEGVTSIVASGLDITQRKKAEEALVLAKESAESANSAKSDFLANMSHELRTPLNAILGFSETMMLEVFGEIGSDRYKEYIKDIHVSAEHLLGIINDILDLSKIEAGSLELDETELDMASLVQSAVDMARSNPHTAVPSISTEIQSVLPSLMGNQRSMMQILLNLLSNAVKFTEGDGQITVLVKAERGHSLSVAVKDTGRGIPKQERITIFDPFSQVEGGDNNEEGAGLGLTITKSLVEMIGGTIELDSEVGVGTTVTLTFPDQRLNWGQAAE